jgi:transposase
VEFESSESAAALVGMQGFRLLAAAEVDGELHQLVETTATVLGCPTCGTRARSKGRRKVRVRDLPAGGRRVVVEWWKRIWRCPDLDCDVTTWTEQAEAIEPRASMTERARAEACRQVGEQNRSVACVARDFGVGWSTIMAAVEAYGRPMVEDPERTTGTAALGLDEVAFLRANARRHTTFATNFVDLERGRLLDVVPGRSAKAVEDWLGTRSAGWLAGVRTVAIDPFRGYANGVAVHLGRVTVVVDPFHVVALANRAIDDVRRRVQNETLGHRGRSGDALYEIRRLLLRGIERHTERSRARLDAGLAAGDPRDEVLDALLAKEGVRSMYAAASGRAARRCLDAAIAECRESAVPELHRLAKTLGRWRTEILAHHTTGASNGATEAVNLVVKKVVRVAHGFRSFKNFRLRVLLHCGVKWHTPAAARIRGRSPRLVA